jgi:hypothetical protein
MTRGYSLIQSRDRKRIFTALENLMIQAFNHRNQSIYLDIMAKTLNLLQNLPFTDILATRSVFFKTSKVV